MADANIIEAIKEKIIKAVAPDKIILFGSRSKEDAAADSDIDLVVIWDSDLNQHKRNLFLSRLFPKRTFSLDIFAFTKEEAERFKDIAGTIVYEAFHNGKVIYG